MDSWRKDKHPGISAGAGLKPVTDAQGDGQRYEIIGLSGGFVVKILTADRKSHSKFTAEEIGKTHFDSCRQPPFCSRRGSKRIAAVDNPAAAGEGKSGGQRNVGLPAERAADGCFTKNLDRDDGLTRVDRIIGIGSGTGIWNIVLVGKGDIGSRYASLEPMVEDPGDRQFTGKPGAIGPGMFCRIIVTGNGIE